MKETHSFNHDSEYIDYKLKIRELVREGYHLTEREIMGDKTFSVRNTFEKLIIFVNKTVDCPGQNFLDFGVG